MDKIMSSLQ